MTDWQNWRTAFLRQARSDWDAYQKTVEFEWPSCQLKNILGMKRSQQMAHFNQLLPLAHEIELLAPALAQSGPNPEYPWKDASGNVLAPADYPFQLIKQLQKTRQGIQLLKHIEVFLKRFEELFM